MVTNPETTTKISKWLLEETRKFINKNKKNKSDFPSNRNFIDPLTSQYMGQMHNSDNDWNRFVSQL